MPYKATADQTDAVTTASVTLRDVPYLRRAMVNAVYDMTHRGNWIIPDGVDEATVMDYANEVFESLEFSPQAPQTQEFTIGAITTSAGQTVTIQGLRRASGAAFDVAWGDNFTSSYPAGYTSPVSHQYAAAGVYEIAVKIPPSDVSWLVVIDPKVIIGVGTIRALSNLQVMQFDSTPYVFVAPLEIAANTALSFVYVRNAAGVGRLTGWSNKPALSTLRINNAYTTPEVDALLLQLWNASSVKTSNGGSIHIAGSNAAPSGVFESRCPPINGLQWAYQLLYDTCARFSDPAKRWSEVIRN